MDRRAFVFSAAALAAGCASPAPARAQSSSRYAAAARYSAERRGVSLLVMREGRILFEDYPNAGGIERGWELASGTKSFTGIMAAAAVQDGLLDLDEPAFHTLEEWRDDPLKRRISARHLLTLTSGLESRSGIARPPPYREALNAPVTHEPGTHFEYGPAPFQAFGELLRRKLRQDRDPVAYLRRRVLSPIGVAPVEWRRGRDGMPFMPQGAHFTARAWAGFGQCVLEGGRGLVDRATLRACFTPSAANPGYGLSWWLLRPGLIPPSRAAGIDFTAEQAARLGVINMAAGAGDQRLYLVPERGMVIARQANRILRGMRARGDARWSDSDFLSLVLEA